MMILVDGEAEDELTNRIILINADWSPRLLLHCQQVSSMFCSNFWYIMNFKLNFYQFVNICVLFILFGLAFHQCENDLMAMKYWLNWNASQNWHLQNK